MKRPPWPHTTCTHPQPALPLPAAPRLARLLFNPLCRGGQLILQVKLQQLATAPKAAPPPPPTHLCTHKGGHPTSAHHRHRQQCTLPCWAWLLASHTPDWATLRRAATLPPPTHLSDRAPDAPHHRHRQQRILLRVHVHVGVYVCVGAGVGEGRVLNLLSSKLGTVTALHKTRQNTTTAALTTQ